MSSRIIVDTSVWIDFFRGRLSHSLHEGLTSNIRLNVVAITDIIRHEILVGTSTIEQYRSLARLIGVFECLRIADGDIPAFDEFAWKLKRQGFRGKYTDAAIAFVCFRYELPLLTFDKYFRWLGEKKIIHVVSELLRSS